VDLDWFRRIVPCGVADRGVTTMRRLLGHDLPLTQVAERLACEFGVVFGRSVAPLVHRPVVAATSLP
jgi:lipoyl(octanoyl) transferase